MFYQLSYASLMTQTVKNMPAIREIWIPWRRARQPTPVLLPRESPWTEEPGRLQSMGSQRVRYDWATKQGAARLFTALVLQCSDALSTVPLEHKAHQSLTQCLLHFLSALRTLVQLPCPLWVAEFKGCPVKPAPTQGASGEQNAFSDCSLPPIGIGGGGERASLLSEFVNNWKLVFKWFLFSLGILASFFAFGTEIKAEISDSLISPHDSSFAFQNWSTCGITRLYHPGQQAPTTLAPVTGFMKDSSSIDPGQEGVF